MTRLQPKTLIVMVDMRDGWKKQQEYLAIYNAFEHLWMQILKKEPMTKKIKNVKFDLYVDNCLVSLHFLTLSWIPQGTPKKANIFPKKPNVTKFPRKILRKRFYHGF